MQLKKELKIKKRMQKKFNFVIINGPNLNMLGQREPHLYGKMTLSELMKYTNKKLAENTLNFLMPEVEWFQSNIEGEIIEKIQSIFQRKVDGVIINPGGYAHTSVAIMDALKILECPIVEVHITNTQSREEFRQRKLTAQAAESIMEGLGKDTYYLAILSQLLKKEDIS